MKSAEVELVRVGGDVITGSGPKPKPDLAASNTWDTIYFYDWDYKQSGEVVDEIDKAASNDPIILLYSSGEKDYLSNIIRERGSFASGDKYSILGDTKDTIEPGEEKIENLKNYYARDDIVGTSGPRIAAKDFYELITMARDNNDMSAYNGNYIFKESDNDVYFEFIGDGNQ